MKKTYLVANWKSNKTNTEALLWVDTVKASWPQISSNLEIILCLPLIHLEPIIHMALPVKLGAQDISAYPDGAYTGEVSARMLSPLVKYSLVGHSERRRHLHEDNHVVARKVTEAVEFDITPIIAVSKQNWHEQLGLIPPRELQKSLIMYEPPEAISQQSGPIGEGDAAPIEEVLHALKEIKSIAPQTPLLYGGSVKSHNIAEYLNEDSIDGVVPGSASLNAEEWLKLVSISQEIRG